MTVTTRRERRERELRKRQREKRGGHPSRGGGGGRNILIGVGVIVLFVVALLGLRQAGVLTIGPVVSTNSPLPTAAVASDDPARGIREADQGRDHVNPGTPVTYTGALPPSSGAHWPQPAGPVKAGIYDQQLPFEATTHNLEHGGIVIAYSGLSVGELTQLKQFINETLKTKYQKVLLEPYAGLKDAKITAVAWGWRLNLQTLDTASLFKFITVHYDAPEAPEPGAAW